MRQDFPFAVIAQHGEKAFSLNRLIPRNKRIEHPIIIAVRVPVSIVLIHILADTELLAHAPSQSINTPMVPDPRLPNQSQTHVTEHSVSRTQHQSTPDCLGNRGSAFKFFHSFSLKTFF
jgi:hypothetical protein